jgi:hypothetical protein
MYMKSNRSFAVAVLPRSESPALLEDEEELQWKNKFSHFTVTVFWDVVQVINESNNQYRPRLYSLYNPTI